MATTWVPEYVVNFTTTGDETRQAIKKACIDELARIYNVLSYLSMKVGSYASVSITDNYSDESQIPEDGGDGQIVSVTTTAEGVTLFGWNGEEWIQLNTDPYPLATTTTPGLVLLSTEESILSGVPMAYAGAVSEKTLVDVIAEAGSGFTAGTIVMWYGNPAVIPSGWVVCDGSLGSPDLRGTFIRGSADTVGEKGGHDSVKLEISCVPKHSHTYSLSITLPAHSHTYSDKDTGYSFTHGHGPIFDSRLTTYNGEHGHSGNYMSSTVTIVRAATTGSPINPAIPLWSLVGSTITTEGGGHSHPGSVSGSATTAYMDHNHTMGDSTYSTVAVSTGGEGVRTDPYGQPATAITVPTRPINMALIFLMKV